MGIGAKLVRTYCIHGTHCLSIKSVNETVDLNTQISSGVKDEFIRRQITTDHDQPRSHVAVRLCGGGAGIHKGDEPGLFDVLRMMTNVYNYITLRRTSRTFGSKKLFFNPRHKAMKQS